MVPLQARGCPGWLNKKTFKAVAMQWNASPHPSGRHSQGQRKRRYHHRGGGEARSLYATPPPHGGLRDTGAGVMVPTAPNVLFMPI